MRGLLSRQFLLKVLLIGLFVFALYSNIGLIIRNHRLTGILRAKKTETARQAFNNKKLKLLITYYQTPSYQEVEARRRLGLKKPDEIVYAVNGLSLASGDQRSGLSDNLYADIQPAPVAPKSNIRQWREYLFGD